MSNIIDFLFKKKHTKTPTRNIDALAIGLASPAVQVFVQNSASLSHFGGSPNISDEIAWPEKNGSKLSFLARISLPEVHRANPVAWLPTTGALLFFYDMDQQPWGFDPKDSGGWAVLYAPDLDSPAEPVHQAESPIPFRHIGFRRIDSFPSYERDAVAALRLSDEELDAYGELSGQPFQGKPKHQISGYPAPVQGGSMELECQLVSNGLYCGDPTGYNDPRAPALEADAHKWKLLFQFDSDDDLDVMWGDCGTIYYWIQEAPARASDFSGSWLVLQCG